MPRIKKFSSKSKFRGNQFTSGKKRTVVNEDTVVCASTSTCGSNHNLKCESASKKKLNLLTNTLINEEESVIIEEHSVTDSFSNDKVQSGNIVVSLDLLCPFISEFLVCRGCGGNVILCENSSKRTGVVNQLEICCESCGFSTQTMTSNITRSRLYENNIRLVYGLRSIGKGCTAGQMLCGIMNLPQPPARFATYNKVIGAAVAEVSESSMLKASREAVSENDNSSDISVAVDGSWQKRGHQSLNGVVSATSIDTGKVIDVDVLSKYCQVCRTNPHSDHKCQKNYDGASGSMEVAGAVNIFNRSEHSRGARYVNYLGDGDSKAYNKVVDAQPYGQHIQINKLECVGHVQKRMGTRLRRLVKEKKDVVLSDGKKLSGQKRLTKTEIDNLQNYYGSNIRRNTGNVEDMRQSVWATYFHKLSTNDNPQHGLCPKTPNTWCKYNKMLTEGKTYEHKHSLPCAVMEAIKPIFKDLSQPELLKKCLHGRTQNPNESFNSVIWTRLPKTVYVGYETLKLGVYDAVMCFNDGVTQKKEVLTIMGIEPGLNTLSALTAIDRKRVNEAEKKVKNVEKLARKSRRSTKRKLEDQEDADDPEYGAGMF